MKFEKEITVEIVGSLPSLEKLLAKNNFVIKEIYDVNDIYLLNKNTKVTDDILSLLKNCVLIRDVVEKDKETKMIIYKYKEYNEQKEIIKNGKVKCHINSIEEALELFRYLNYKEIIRIYDHLLVYSNGEVELVVQLVNDKHIYLEIEASEDKDIKEMKQIIKKYKIPFKDDNYFVKKAEIEILENLDKIKAINND